jgi:hypothetical protein
LGRAPRTSSERTTCGNHLGGHCFGGHSSDTSRVLSGSVNAHHAEVRYCTIRSASFTCTVDRIRDGSFVADTLTHAYLPRFTTVAFHTLTALYRQQVLYSTSLAAGRHDNGTRYDELHHIIIVCVDNLSGSTFQKYREAYPWNNADTVGQTRCKVHRSGINIHHLRRLLHQNPVCFSQRGVYSGRNPVIFTPPKGCILHNFVP